MFGLLRCLFLPRQQRVSREQGQEGLPAHLGQMPNGSEPFTLSLPLAAGSSQPSTPRLREI